MEIQKENTNEFYKKVYSILHMIEYNKEPEKIKNEIQNLKKTYPSLSKMLTSGIIDYSNEIIEKQKPELKQIKHGEKNKLKIFNMVWTQKMKLFGLYLNFAKRKEIEQTKMLVKDIFDNLKLDDKKSIEQIKDIMLGIISVGIIISPLDEIMIVAGPPLKIILDKLGIKLPEIPKLSTMNSIEKFNKLMEETPEEKGGIPDRKRTATMVFK